MPTHDSKEQRPGDALGLVRRKTEPKKPDTGYRLLNPVVRAAIGGCSDGAVMRFLFMFQKAVRKGDRGNEISCSRPVFIPTSVATALGDF
jgi:hypothetical protein